VLVLFEGSAAAVAAQVAAAQSLVGGREVGAEAWEESRRRQAAARGRVPFESGRLAAALTELEEEAVVRPAAGVAYTPSDSLLQGDDPALAVLLERIRLAFDPHGVLAA
jgi:hypothetical protein